MLLCIGCLILGSIGHTRWLLVKWRLCWLISKFTILPPFSRHVSTPASTTCQSTGRKSRKLKRAKWGTCVRISIKAMAALNVAKERSACGTYQLKACGGICSKPFCPPAKMDRSRTFEFYTNGCILSGVKPTLLKHQRCPALSLNSAITVRRRWLIE